MQADQITKCFNYKTIFASTVILMKLDWESNLWNYDDQVTSAEIYAIHVSVNEQNLPRSIVYKCD